MPLGTNELRRRRDRASRPGVLAPISPPPGARSAGLSADWRVWSPSLAPIVDPGPTVTLGLIGGQRLLRDATASLLTAQDGLQVMGTFESAAHFLASGWAKAPSVLLLDCDGGEPDSWESALAALAAPRRVESRIVLLCQAVGEQVVRCAIEHRVSGMLLKSYSTEDIRAALVYTATGRTVMPAGWQQVVASQAGRLGLSPRHRQILALIAEGRRNEEIALHLRLSPNTIKFHVRALYARLGVRNRVEAANLHAQMTSGDT